MGIPVRCGRHADPKTTRLPPDVSKGYIVLSDAQQLQTSQRMAERSHTGLVRKLTHPVTPAGHTGMQQADAAVHPACIDNSDPGILERALAGGCGQHLLLIVVISMLTCAPATEPVELPTCDKRP